ncbi:stage II sporulation protein P [Paenibacillus sp. J31TS4]|uniref:stage II sporulation protein P n=1 Tax=Paenibacillus sp. J31TS4 TaxID=2807195 RepID=UPI001B1B0319|nr:stage II sporulation protein P [Paenibacillus sp. J31TS4]GIP39573.1 stage II sporulation protein P [Paenibacillus sp. J31TS4]
MKWTAMTMDLSRVRKTVQTVRLTGRSLLALSVSTLLFFVLLGAAGYAQSYLRTSPVSSMKGLAASVSQEFFLDMMKLEIPHLKNETSSSSTFSQANMFSFVFRLLTNVNPNDPKTLIAHEVPGLASGTPVLIRGSHDDGGPVDYPMPADHAGGGTPPVTDPTPAGTPAPTPQPTPEQAGKQTTSGKKVVMVYTTHNRESYLPELPGVTDPNKAYDPVKNVTLVGKRLAQKLEEQGVGAIAYSQDYSSTEQDFNYYKSYKYSAKTVKEAFAAHPDIQFVFDLHRDSSKRDKTTKTINGVDYAQVYFIIGQRNPNWETNESFASQLHAKLEKKLPGLSRGVWGKNPNEGDAEYNQSLSPNSVLIEIGGPYNSLEECYRTADALAGIIAEQYWEAEKVGAPAAPAKQ